MPVVLSATANQSAHAPLAKINIGTRKSQLAIAQVDSIIAQLKTFAPEPQYVSRVVSTMADENQVKAFSAFDSKSIWTEELEQLLMEGGLDVVVHCLKGRLISGFLLQMDDSLGRDITNGGITRHADFAPQLLRPRRDL